MQLYNLKHPSQQVSFASAVTLGLGKDRGLFFPKKIPKIQNINALLDMPFVERSQMIIHYWLGDEIDQKISNKLVSNAFNFALPLVKIDANRWCLELFHGPTLAFKDFGARFMAQCVNQLAKNDKPLTILTATSGDTGAAVADAFYGLDNVQVVVLYPKGKISQLQEKMFATLGGNIHTLAITGDFDACQALVKQAFEDNDIQNNLQLNSANSINFSRLLAQVCYYFEAVAQFRQTNPNTLPVISVPCGNFGNLTAGLLAKAMGLPATRFIAATNANDTVPRYLASGQWQVKMTQPTMSNAMDVSEPSNWPRIEALCQQQKWADKMLKAKSLSELETLAAMQQLLTLGYQSEPHGAIAAQALQNDLGPNEQGIFLATAHPAKFKDVVDRELDTDLPLPKALNSVVNKAVLSKTLTTDFDSLKQYLLAL